MKMPVIPVRLQGWARNVGSGYLDAAVGGLIFLILTPIIVRELGTETYAIWVLSQTIAFYLAFLDLGFASAQVRFHARFAAKSHEALARKVISTSLVAMVIAGVIAALLGFGLAFIEPERWMQISPSLAPDFRAVIVLLSVQMLVSFVGASVENIYEGAQRFDLRNFRSIAIRLITAAVLLWFLWRGATVVELVAVELAGVCLRVAVDLVLTLRVLPGWWREAATLHRRIFRRLRGFALWTSLDEILTEGGAQLDHFLIVALFPIALLTPYSLCTSVAGVLLMAVHPIVETFFPLASGLHAQRRQADLAQLLVAGSKLATAVAAPIAIVLLFFGQTIVELWVPEVAGEIPHGLMAAVVCDYLASMYLWTATILLVAIGRMRLVVFLTLIEIAAGIGLMIALAPKYGLMGVALASLTANVAIGFALQIPLAARAAGVTLSDLVGSAMIRIALVSIPAVLTAAALQRAVDEPGFFELGGIVLAVLAVYGASLWLFGMRRDERAHYLSLLR